MSRSEAPDDFRSIGPETFNDADLAGRPAHDRPLRQRLAAPSLVFSLSTYTYTPFVEVGDEAFPDRAGDRVFRAGLPGGIHYFPLGSQL